MLDLIETYEFVQSYYKDRLEQAEQARQIKIVKSVSQPAKSRKRLLVILPLA